MFVTLEGIEGSGKSTLLSSLVVRLRALGADALATREPGGTPAGDAIRGMFLNRSLPISALTEALLVNAARAQHVGDVIAPALSAGRPVICDRYVDSTLAYQGYGRGLDLNLLREICDVATGGLAPDLTLVLDVPVSVSRARSLARRRNADRLEAEDDAFHERVRRGFLELAQSPRHRILDATLAADALVEVAMQALTLRDRAARR